MSAWWIGKEQLFEATEDRHALRWRILRGFSGGQTWKHSCLSGPRSLWYDKSRGRLYIGDGGRVIVITILPQGSYGLAIDLLWDYRRLWI